MNKEIKKWMPMFWGEYFGKTRHLTCLQHGAYMQLIGYYWLKGKLPTDEKLLARIVGVPASTFRKQIREALLDFFNADWTHDRVEAELAYAIEKSKRLSANAKLRLSNGKASAGASADTPTPTPTPTKKERKKNPVAEPPEFSEFWASKPDREGHNGRWPAVLAYLKAMGRGADPAQINAAAKRGRAESDKTEPRFIKTAVAWLNARMYEDYHVKPEAETNLEFDEATKLWRYREGYEPTDEEREAHAKYRRSAIAARLP